MWLIGRQIFPLRSQGLWEQSSTSFKTTKLAVVSNTPIPEDVWDRLLLNNKARISGGTGSTTQGETGVPPVRQEGCRSGVRFELVRRRGRTRDRGFRLNPLYRRVVVEGRGRLRRHHSAGQDLHASHSGKVPEKSLGTNSSRLVSQSTNLRRNLILPLCGDSGGRQGPASKR